MVQARVDRRECLSKFFFWAKTPATGLTSGYGNTLIGTRSGQFLTSGHGNVFMGDEAGQRTSDGINNIAIGIQAGDANTSGSREYLYRKPSWPYKAPGGNNNIALGYQAKTSPPPT